MNWFYNWIAEGLIAETGRELTTNPYQYDDFFVNIIWRKRLIAKFVIRRGKANWEVLK
jgi:hypothetical protein